MSDWTSVPLSELTAAPATYGVVQPGTHTPAGAPMLRVNNFDGRSLDLSDVMRIATDVEAKYERTRLRPGDVLITIVGTVGRVAIVPDDLSGWNIARAIALVRPKAPELSRWIAYVLKSPHAQHQLGVAANTTVQTTINLKDLRTLQVPLPHEDTRKDICDVLGALDDRIENLRKSTETLDAIADTLFRSLFVDFNCTPPHAMQESEVGLIPVGWTVRPLDSVADFLNGLALQKFPPESESDYLPVIKIAQLRAGNTECADKASSRLKPEYIVADGDVLFSWSGSLEVVIWTGGAGALNQHLFKVTSDQVPKWFYYFATRQHLPEFRAIAAGKATTMGHIQRGHLTAAKVVVPPPDVITGCNATMAALLDHMIENAVRVRTLSKMRDALLPRLVSGRLRRHE